MAVDTVFNGEGRPVFVKEPAVVRRRLKATYPDSWVKVHKGETGESVTIPEYLYGEKIETVVKLIEEVMRKKDLPMYRRDPSQMKKHVERAARRIIETIESLGGDET